MNRPNSGNLYERLLSERRNTKHWLHVILSVVTMGMWLPVYLIRVTCNASHNRRIDDKMNGALAAMSQAVK